MNKFLRNQIIEALGCLIAGLLFETILMFGATKAWAFLFALSPAPLP